MNSPPVSMILGDSSLGAVEGEAELKNRFSKRSKMSQGIEQRT